MTSTLTQVLDRLDVVLKANVPAGCQVFRDRADSPSRAETPCINVLSRGAQVESFAQDWDKHTLSVELVISVRAEPGTPAVEAVHAAVHAPIVKDATLLGLCDSVRLEDDNPASAEADVTALDKTVRYRFTYLINQSTL